MANACPECGSLMACLCGFVPPWDPRVDLQAAGGFAMDMGMEMARLEQSAAFPPMRVSKCMQESMEAERNRALAAAEALEARYVAGIRHALRVVHAVHSTLPDGETVPRASTDAMALAVEGALLAMLGGEG